MAKPQVNGEGYIPGGRKWKTAINAVYQMVFEKDTFSIEMLYLFFLFFIQYVYNIHIIKNEKL